MVKPERTARTDVPDGDEQGLVEIPAECKDCGHEAHEGVCREWVPNYTPGRWGLDKPCGCEAQ